ncbi:MAG TPA: hypothetical protein VLH77_00505 [Gammaproteobacteria bacterium]|nr:hypothetical protein [Gammaproteobacteria bacterium]
MDTRTEASRSAALAVRDEEKQYTNTRSRATQTEAATSCSTSCILQAVGLARTSFKEKFILLFLAALISQKLVELTENIGNACIVLFAEEDDSTLNHSKNLETFISLIIFIISLKILEKEFSKGKERVRTIENSLNNHQQQLDELKIPDMEASPLSHPLVRERTNQADRFNSALSLSSMSSISFSSSSAPASSASVNTPSRPIHFTKYPVILLGGETPAPTDENGFDENSPSEEGFAPPGSNP